MRVMCKHCGGKARISSTDRISNDFSRLYCQCSDVKNCGHTFVMDLGFSHTINPPSSVIDQLLIERFRQMPEERQQELFGFAVS